MRNKLIILICSFVSIATFLLVCTTETKASGPTEQNFQAPIVTLNSIEVAHYWGWWYFSNKVEPTKGTAGNYGAPLDLAFIFDIQNPNSYPILMDSLKFTVQLEKWWVGVPEFAFPISVKEGSAVFRADDLIKVSAFSGTFPK